MSARVYLLGARAEVIDSACEEVLAARGARNAAIARIRDVTAVVRDLSLGPAETDRFFVTTRLQSYKSIDRSELCRCEPDLYFQLLRRYGRSGEIAALIIKEKS